MTVDKQNHSVSVDLQKRRIERRRMHHRAQYTICRRDRWTHSRSPRWQLRWLKVHISVVLVKHNMDKNRDRSTHLYGVCTWGSGALFLAVLVQL